MTNNPSSPALGVSTVKVTDSHARAFRILVVIPTLGERLETLGRTLSSIQEQAGVLVDTVLVAKTKSSDLSAIADHYRSRIIYHPGNISAAVNAGFSQVCEAHRYVCWLGDDDMLRPNALATSSDLLERNQEAVVSYGSCDYINLNGELLFNRRPPPGAPALLQFIPGLIKQETCLFRLSAFQRAGGLDEKLKYTMDLDLLLKLHRLGPFVKADQVLAAFCWHPGSLTISNRTASLAEAQRVQHRHARGIVRMTQPMWKYLVRYLILTANWKINRDLNRLAVTEIRRDRK